MGPEKDFEKKVASWVDLIATAAEKGSDKLYKTVYCTLGRQLYDRGLRQAQQSLVDEAQEQRKIDYKQEDQVKAVQEIVDLIAKDPPIAVVTRLIDSFNKVTSCKRRPNEDLNRFVSRFRGLAAEHLMRAGTKNPSQIGEVLAITLLNNATLSEASLTNAKLRLIGVAENRKTADEKVHNKVSIGFKEAKRLLLRVHKLQESLECLRKKGTPRSDKCEDIIARYNQVAQGIMPLHGVVKNNEKLNDATSAIASSAKRCILSLDDAVSVLESLAQTTSRGDQTVTKAQMDSA